MSPIYRTRSFIGWTQAPKTSLLCREIERSCQEWPFEYLKDRLSRNSGVRRIPHVIQPSDNG